MARIRLFAALWLIGGIACSGGDGGGGANPVTTVPCRVANCGDPTFRAAIPNRNLVRIQFGGASSSSSALTSDGTIGSSSSALDSVSDAYLGTLEYVDGINEVVDSIFDDLEYAAGGEPDVEEELEHEWRDATDAGAESVLELTTTDDELFDFDYYEGPAGFEPLEGEEIISGTVTVDENDELVEFHFTLDLDNATAADPELDATGTIDLAALPLEEGFLELQFDLNGVSFGDEEPEDSITTYWIFEEGSYGLEYLGDFAEESITVYVRWDDEGGRYDHHVEFTDEDLGLIDYIATTCWVGEGAEVFDADAYIDQDLSYYGELDGIEDDCDFGPVDGHPDPGLDFENLPAEGEWDALEFGDFFIDFDCDVEVEDCVCDPEIEECEDECDPDFEECEEECDPDFEECEEECDPDFEECEEECDPDFEECEEECDPDFEECEEECDPDFEECEEEDDFGDDE